MKRIIAIVAAFLAVAFLTISAQAENGAEQLSRQAYPIGIHSSIK